MQIQRILKNERIVEDIVVLEDGSLVYEMPSIEEIQQYCFEQIKLLPDQFKDLDYEPKEYPVTFSQKLKTIAQTLKPA